MTPSKDFTPADFFRLAMEAAAHEAELKIKLAREGVVERSERPANRDEAPSA